MTLRQATLGIILFGLLVGVVLSTKPSQPFRQSPGIKQNPPGILVTDEPVQSRLTHVTPAISYHGWTLQPLTRFEIKGRVLAKQHYSDTFKASLSAWDLSLGWRNLSDESVLAQSEIWLDNRIYYWRYSGTLPVSKKEFVTQAANIHIIPANAAIQKKIASLRVGSLVNLEGWLVEATHPRAKAPWRSSLTRDDEGPDAFELLYVRSASELSKGR